MDFFYQANGTITATLPLGQWNVGGFREVAVHLWFQGAAGAKVFPTLYYNNLAVANEPQTLSPGGIATLAKVYPVFAPTLSIVIYNPSASMAYNLRLYATCCETGSGKTKKKRTISAKVKLASLIPAGR